MKRKSKLHYTKRLFGLLLVLCMALTFMPVTAHAGVTDVTGGTTGNVYTHTYHTKFVGEATIYVLGANDETVDTRTVSHTTEFLVGNVSDSTVQEEIAVFDGKVEEVVNSYRSQNYSVADGLTQKKATTTFDHFESTLEMEMLAGDNEDAILIGGGVTQRLDVHEYQVYEVKTTIILKPGIQTPTQEAEAQQTAAPAQAIPEAVQEEAPAPVVVPEGVLFVENFNRRIRGAGQNGVVDYDSGLWNCLSDENIRCMADNPQVTINVTFVYQNVTYRFTIPAGTDFSGVLNDEEGIYGYLRLCELLNLPVTVIE